MTFTDTECGLDEDQADDDYVQQSQSTSTNISDNTEDLEMDIGQEWESARFLLKATEEYSLTHSGVDSFCECIQSFVDDISSQISKKVESQLPESLPSKQSIVASCQPGDLFEGLTTRYKREKYYEDTFNYVVRFAREMY